jgi:hypothetical protein
LGQTPPWPTNGWITLAPTPDKFHPLVSRLVCAGIRKTINSWMPPSVATLDTVSGDKDLQALDTYQRVKVLSPREFIELMGL